MPDGAPLALSRQEFPLLETMMERPTLVRSRPAREEILYGWQEAVKSNAIEAHVHHLRQKLGCGVIETPRGAGYRVEPQGGSTG
ncbi:winged helix-turn-helix domain-containing protein [Teichococcus deserti]|uniref:winged helix-turn-helix domain-containing protein n=1 Tax=Teichococcus deserti TaxID=1817963 RepID=UPI001F624F2B|nr:winged helix-turn-helix domain-containing protein [Pseudoroseomonas deserti]